MKRFLTLIGILIPIVTVNCQTFKEINNLIGLINSEEYRKQDSIIWIDLWPLKEKSDSIEEIGKKEIKSGDNVKLQELMKQYTKCTKDKLKVLSNYPDFVYSAYYLLILAMREKDNKSREPKIGSLDDYEKVYESFSNEVKESYFGKGLKMLFEYELPKIGDKVSDIELYTINGDLVKLSDYRGKYVLLKSYLSGCYGWSIEHPKIKEVYQNLDKNKIVVIGIGIDDSKDEWIDNMNKNEFNWISTFQPIGGKMTTLFNINSNTRNVLIDPDGIIVDLDISIQSGHLLPRLEAIMNK